jgi:hypothetical protein
MRSLNRYLNHRVYRHSTRMLAGSPRPRPPDYLALYCRTIRRIIQIDNRLLPFLREQHRLAENQQFFQESQAALAKIYGPNRSPLG